MHLLLASGANKDLEGIGRFGDDLPRMPTSSSMLPIPAYPSLDALIKAVRPSISARCLSLLAPAASSKPMISIAPANEAQCKAVRRLLSATSTSLLLLPPIASGRCRRILAQMPSSKLGRPCSSLVAPSSGSINARRRAAQANPSKVELKLRSLASVGHALDALIKAVRPYQSSKSGS